MKFRKGDLMLKLYENIKKYRKEVNFKYKKHLTKLFKICYHYLTDRGSVISQREGMLC